MLLLAGGGLCGYGIDEIPSGSSTAALPSLPPEGSRVPRQSLACTPGTSGSPPPALTPCCDNLKYPQNWPDLWRGGGGKLPLMHHRWAWLLQVLDQVSPCVLNRLIQNSSRLISGCEGLLPAQWNPFAVYCCAWRRVTSDSGFQGRAGLGMSFLCSPALSDHSRSAILFCSSNWKTTRIA